MATKFQTPQRKQENNRRGIHVQKRELRRHMHSSAIRAREKARAKAVARGDHLDDVLMSVA
jgi:hypothetical protein